MPSSRVTSSAILAQPPQADNCVHDDSSLNTHLWFPEPDTQEQTVATPQASSSSSLLRDRLYIGNLHPTVDEYTLLQIFTKFGKVSKLDFLFHKAGPNRGKPRGYAFLEYLHDMHHDAQTALESVNGKMLRGRKLVVTFAHQAPLEQPGGPGQVGRARRIDARPTTLSMMKSRVHPRSEGTDSKIAMMEAKLRQMESSSPNSLPLKPSSALLASAPRQHPTSVNAPMAKVSRSTSFSGHRPPMEADSTHSRSSASLHARPDIIKSSASCKRLIVGVKIVKDRNK